MMSGHLRHSSIHVSIFLALFLTVFSFAEKDTPSTFSDPNAQELRPLLTGAVLPSKRVELTAPLGTIVAKVNVEETQLVKEGDLLILMDDKIPQAQVKVNETQVLASQMEYEEAKLIYEFEMDVLQRGASGEGQVRRAELTMNTREMAVDVAKAELEASKVQLEQYKIKAPFDGEVKVIVAEKGARLNQGDVALEMVSRYELEAKFDLPVSLIYEMEVGETYILNAGTPVNRQLTGTLKSRDFNFDYATGKFRAVFTIENRDLKLPSGFEADLLWPQPE